MSGLFEVVGGHYVNSVIPILPIIPIVPILTLSFLLSQILLFQFLFQVASSYYASPVAAWSRIRSLFLHLWCALLEGA